MSRRGAVEISSAPIDSSNPFLYHKTTNRAAYDAAIASRPGFEDALLYNERGEVTESTIANLVVETGGELLTPRFRPGCCPAHCGRTCSRTGRFAKK
ncbi:MAG TPA: aminotransferase class IV [Vicinamibacterales bacterium]|nr:aminotransferase class IV [Vicinamibacterales bacterium]